MFDDTRDIAVLALSLSVVTLIGILWWYVVSRPMLGMVHYRLKEEEEDEDWYVVRVTLSNTGRRSMVLTGRGVKWTPEPNRFAWTDWWNDGETGVGPFSEKTCRLMGRFDSDRDDREVSVQVRFQYRPYFWSVENRSATLHLPSGRGSSP